MSGMDRLTELLPCPFCGCDKIVIHYDHPDSVGPLVGGGYYISHPLWKSYPEAWECNAQPYPGYFGSEAQAVTAWNRRASHAAPAPSDHLVSVGKASGLVEARVSLAARQIRQTLRDYGHRCAETSLPELIAADVDAALRQQDEVHTPAPSDGLREAVETIVNTHGFLTDLGYILGKQNGNYRRAWASAVVRREMVKLAQQYADDGIQALTPAPAQEGEPRHD